MMGALWDIGAAGVAALPAAARVFWDLRWSRALAWHARAEVQGAALGAPATSSPDHCATLILCTHNDLSALKAVWTSWRGQRFPDGWLVEWLVVDDGSTDGTSEWLEAKEKDDGALTVLRHGKRRPGKKEALSAGIHKARFDRLVLTDADCMAEPGWASSMAAGLGGEGADGGPDVLVGVCLPASGGPALMAFDALRVAFQYCGEAAAGAPYMGVGRNIAYRRSTWLRIGGFEDHLDLAGGDDDLFVQAVATAGGEVRLTHPPRAGRRIRTLTAADWRDGWRRKRRHLSTVSRYRRRDRIKLVLDAVLDPLAAASAVAGVLGLFHTGTWIPIAALALALAVRTITLSSFSRQWGDGMRIGWLAPFWGPTRWFLLACATLGNSITSSPTWTQRAPTKRS